MKQTLKRLLSTALALTMLIGMVPTQAFAVQETAVYLPEIEIGPDILDHDVFYLATATAEVREDGNFVYLLKVGRGGDAESESTALVKIADMTAKYGEDYVVRVRGERTKVENPDGNFSLMEMMDGSDFEQGTLGTEEEFAEMLENDPEAQTAYREGTETALEFLDEASGLKDKYSEGNPYSEALEEFYGEGTDSLEGQESVEDTETESGESASGSEYDIDADVEAVADWDEGAIPAVENGETIAIGGNADEASDPLRQAVNLFTGQNAASQRLTAEGNVFEDLQAIANVMTNVVVGASVELTFVPGETEKYLEIVPKDNKTGDGNRMFYVILGAPGGTTTNSAASTCAFTILDDEEQEPAVVSFSDAIYYADSENVTVTVERSGAMNTVISTKIVTTGNGTAQAGRDYSEVDAELVFPFGVSHLSLDIPVRTEYLSGAGDFELALEPTAGCMAGEYGSATVYLDGGYTGKASLYAAQNNRLMGASRGPALTASGSGNGSGDVAQDVNTLQNVKTLDDGMGIHSWIDWASYQDPNNFSGSNRWRDDWKGYLLEWINRADRQGTAAVSWRHWDSGYYWTSGFQVDWQHGGGHSGDTAWLMVEVAGIDPPYWEDLGQHQANGNWDWYSFASSARFGRTTANIYPNQAQFDNWKGEAPYRIAFYNKGSCDNCDPVCIYDVKAILRPFQINLMETDSLLYLKADGSREKVTDASTTAASIVGADSLPVFYAGDEFTVYTPTYSNVDVYGYLKDINWVDSSGNKLLTLASVTDQTAGAIKVTLSKDVINSMGNTDTEQFKAMLNQVPYEKDTDGHMNYGYANYALMNIRAELGYIDSSVTLRNPYDFPVTMTISGTEYKLAAKETRKIKAPDGPEFHLGDTLAVTKIDLGAASSGHYTPIGISYSALDKKGKLVKGTINFSGSNAVNFAGFDGDGRLCTKEIIVEPNLQQEDNRIVVRVKTDELAKFDTAIEYDENGKLTHHAGLLAQKGTVDGEYTYFTYADASKTMNGKLYPITVTPLSEDTVATWYDGVALRTYVGNTLYFTAGISASRNIITLSAAPAAGSVTLEGTLKYSNYNMRSKFSGNASNVPAAGAILSAGSAGGVANSEGFITAGPISITGQADQYLRYIVSVNGVDVVKELLLPETLDDADQAEPAILCDFNSDLAMDAYMGGHGKGSLDISGEKDGEGNDYYSFTATGFSPRVSLDNVSANRLSEIQWVKMRVRNVTGVSQVRFLFGFSDNNTASGASDAYLTLEQDTEWHEYLFNYRTLNANTGHGNPGWSTVSPKWMRLEPMLASEVKPGDQIQIDYIAFFPDEASANSYVNKAKSDGKIDISSNFQDGINPAASEIFQDISITGTMTGGYQINNNTFIPVVMGQSATMTVTVKPKRYDYTTTGEDGTTIDDSLTESPLAMQFVVYDQNDVYKGIYEEVDSPQASTDDKGNVVYSFRSRMDFTEPMDSMELTDENGKPILDEDGEPIYVAIDGDGKPQKDENGDYVIVHPGVGLIPGAGDKLYLRLTTNRLAQTSDLANPDGVTTYKEYTYSDVFTGMSFVQPTTKEVPLQMDLDMPIDIEYGDLPFVGSTGMNLSFPFVTLGIMRIYHGYRIYFGVSPVQIMDSIKGTHLSSMSDAGGDYWKSAFSLGSPIESIKDDLSTISNVVDMYKEAALDAKAQGESFSAMSLGSPTWKFDLSIGMYFDFVAANVTQDDYTERDMIFSGMGGYVSVSLGFRMAWYVILPVVFVPGYLGIEINGTIMGFLGANFNKDVQITYDSMHGNTGVKDGITELDGAIRGSASVQVSLGVGLCGTLGFRFAGNVDMLANWEPSDPHGDWGFYVTLSLGGYIDLLLFSIPLMFEVGGWPYGTFEYYANNTDSETVHPNSLRTASLRSASPASPKSGTLKLREGSGEDSMWLGDQMMVQGAFRPNKDKQQILAVNAYEHGDPQLITLADGETLALAFVDSDYSKGMTQRTTLKLSIYDAGTGLWSEPVPVALDNTADFQPSVAQMKDGRLLVAWVSTSDDTITDVSTDEQAMKYLVSMDVYAAIVELDGKAIRTTTVNGVTVADTEVTRISNDRIGDYYDANPTVVCDMESGDAIVYYIKSERVYVDGDEIGEYINPYTNDSVVSYMIYSAQGVEVTKAKPTEYGAEPETETIIEHWLFDYYYPGERDHNTEGLTDEEAEMAYAMLISFFGGQRFLDGPTYLDENNKPVRYAIPDFTAIGYDGLSVCAYTVDPDGSSDTDTDKELYLQVYDFQNHRTKYQTVLTNDNVADTLPQLFRSRVNIGSGSEAHTKLFWYQNGRQVVYIDVTELLDKGLNADGTLKQKADGTTYYTYTDEQGMEHTAPDTREYIYTDADGRTHSRFTDPQVVYFYTDDSHAALQSADFQAVEDDRGNLYILWTEGVTDEDGSTAREIFGTGLVSYESSFTDENSNTVTGLASTGWSKPYRITEDGCHNDELTAAMSGENLVVVHNRYRQELNSPNADTSTQGDKSTYSGETDDSPLIISDMTLVADTLEPCGSVETESIRLYSTDGTAVILPRSGDVLNIDVEVSNNGMNTAQGYKLSLYAGDELIDEIVSKDALVPNRTRTHTFQYILTDDVEVAGLTFRAVAQEMRDAEEGEYYRDTDTYSSDPLEARAFYEISDVETYQSVDDGFRARFTVTNTGNAVSSAGDTLNVKLRGPADLGDRYTDALYSSEVNLAVGESKDFDVPVRITSEMMEDYSFVTSLITVQKEVTEQTAVGTPLKRIQYLSNMVYADFDLAVPMNMELRRVTVAVDDSADIAFTMRLGDKFGSGNDSVTYAVDDLTVAKVEDGKVVGVNGGETTLHATHTVTGATVSSAVTVTGEREVPDLETTLTVDGTGTAAESTSDDGAKSLTLNLGDTGNIEAHSPRPGTITYTSSDPAVVTVDENGRLTAAGAGTAMLTVTFTEEATGRTYTASYNITVTDEEKNPDLETALTVDGTDTSVEGTSDGGTSSLSLIVGDTGRITASSVHEGAVTYASSNPAVVTVDGNGRLTAVGAGTAVITVTLTEAGTDKIYTVTYTVKVSGPSEPFNPYNPFNPVIPFLPVNPPAADQPVKPETPENDSYGETVWHPAACDRGDTCPLGAFDDLDKTSWYHDGVEWALINGVMNGVGEGLFDPDGQTNRAMIVTMLHRMEGAPVVNYAMDFTDVEDGMWYTEAIRWAAANEIVTGYGDGRFGPTDPLTREQLATILYRFAKAKGLGFTGLWAFPLTFDDASDVSDWAYEAVCWMVMQGVIQGTGNNKLSPKGMASRAQVATMLMRYNAVEQDLLRQTVEAEQVSYQTAVSTMSYEAGRARNSINEMN